MAGIAPRAALLAELLGQRILVLDGATGTALAERGLGAADYGGERLLGCHEALVLHRPDVVLDLHRGYLAAGADIVETDTFGGTSVVLADYALADRCREINRRAAELARQACADAEAHDPQRPRFVAGSIGPTTKSLTLTGGITFAEIEDSYAEQVAGLAEGGADVLLVETSHDPLNLKAALLACREAAPHLPIAVSVTLEPTGTTLGGQTVEAAAVMVEPWAPLWVGINCSTGPEPMAEHVRSLAALTPSAVAVVPNAGMPDDEGRYHESPERMAAVLARFAEAGWINLLGGCCGTGVEHVRRIHAVAGRVPPRRPPAYDPARLAGGEAIEVGVRPAPLLVGERTNVLGSRRFRSLVREGRFAEAAEIGRRQIRGGAHVLDVCVADPEGDEPTAMASLLTALRKATRAPVMIDCIDPRVIEVALRLTPGRPVLNSVNLEDGGARLEKVVALARRYGAMVIAGCIDEPSKGGMARTAERKAEVASRLLARIEECGLRRRDVLADPLVFPAATGDPAFRDAAGETVRALTLIKERFEGALTILGISNVSFGLPPAGREVLNAVFLHHCLAAGLDAAIVNTEQLVRFPSLGTDEVRLAEAVLFEGGPRTIREFTARYRDATRRAAPHDVSLSPEERLVRMVVEGTRTGLDSLLDELRARVDPVEIINGPLLRGIDEVGRLFGEGKLIVAEVLVSAEVVQAAVEHLRPHMRSEAATRGSLLLATVRGDVHDIGKNLVSIIFSTNGYRLVDLGVQCPADKLIAAFREQPTDLIGLSGLLVRSAHQMVATAAELAAAGITVPLLVGGAALSERFAREHIAPVYPGPVHWARDAMEGLVVANRLLRREAPEPPAVTREADVRAQTPPPEDAGAGARAKRPLPAPGWRRPARHSIPSPPDLARHVLASIPLDEVFPYLNPQVLLGKHLGVRGSVKRLLADSHTPVRHLAERVERLKDAAVARGWLTAAAVYRFFRARGEGERVVLLDPDGSPLAALPFKRQQSPPFACAADWVEGEAEAGDNVALFVVTAGTGVRERAETLRQEGRLLDSVALQALALESAEATAEWLHSRLRSLWGFPDPPEMTVEQRCRARYRGIRLSFGYPACPDLEPQADLFRLLEPSEIGVRLTEGFMMEPEASLSAVVFHHPKARVLA